jgi:hypothetical protein
MTDAIILSYDPEAAAKLPARFAVPPMPTETGVRPQVAAVAVLAAIDAAEAALEEFRRRALAPLPNLTLIALTLAFYERVTTLLVQALRLSVISDSISNQLALTSNVSAIAKAIDLVNRGVRAKCLANPGWADSVGRGLADFEPTLPGIRELAETARRLAEEEEAKHSETRAKLFAVLTPLRDFIPLVEDTQKALAARPASPAREFAALLLRLAGSAATLMGRILLHAKEQGQGEVPEQTLELGRDLFPPIDAARAAAADGVPTQEAILELAAGLEGVIGRFAGEVNGETTEGADLREQGAMLIAGAQALQATVKRALEAPAVIAPRPKAPPKPKEKPKTDDASKPADEGKPSALANTDRLMQRLNLESEVNMWRWKMQFLEKALQDLD